MLLRGCLKSLGLLVLLVAGYAYWFDQRFHERPATFIFGGVAGLIVFFCLGALLNARTAWQNWRLLSMAGQELELRDGALIAVSGPIHPLGKPLVAPFSGKACVLCEYDLQSSRTRAKNEVGGSDYAGFLMTPSAVRTPLGEVRVLGFPVLERIKDRRCPGYLSAWNARQFLIAHEFEDRIGLKMLSALSAFDVIWSDDDGYVEKNMQLSRVTVDELFPPDLVQGLERLAAWEAEQQSEQDTVDRGQDDEEEEDDDQDHDDTPANGQQAGSRPPKMKLPKLTEQRVEVGEQVCVIGVYNAERGGLLPPGSKGPPNRLLPGSASELAVMERAKVGGLAMGGLVGLAVLHAVILAVMAVKG